MKTLLFLFLVSSPALAQDYATGLAIGIVIGKEDAHNNECRGEIKKEEQMRDSIDDLQGQNKILQDQNRALLKVNNALRKRISEKRF